METSFAAAAAKRTSSSSVIHGRLVGFRVLLLAVEAGMRFPLEFFQWQILLPSLLCQRALDFVLREALVLGWQEVLALNL
jgi:hypothetical protein